MSNHPETHLMSSQSHFLPWYRIWLIVITQPRSQTFEKVMTQTPISFRRAYDWAFIGNWGFAAMFFIFTESFSLEKSNRPFVLATASDVLSRGVAIFFFGLLLLIGFMLLGMLIQMMSRLFGGKGTREQLMYAMGAYWAPLGLITGILSLLPLARYSVLILMVYGIILNIIVTKTIHQFGWGRAIVINFIILSPLWCGAIGMYLDPNKYVIY